MTQSLSLHPSLYALKAATKVGQVRLLLLKGRDHEAILIVNRELIVFHLLYLF